MDLNRGDGQDGQASGPGSADRRGWSQGAQARPSLCLPDTPAAHASRSGPDREGGSVREARQAGCGEGPHGVLTQPEVLRSDQASSPDTEGPPLLRHCPCRLASGLTSAGPGGAFWGAVEPGVGQLCHPDVDLVCKQDQGLGRGGPGWDPRLQGCPATRLSHICSRLALPSGPSQRGQEASRSGDRVGPGTCRHAGGLPRLRSAPRPPWLGGAAAFPTAGVPAPQECRAGEGPRVRNADPACCSHAGP